MHETQEFTGLAQKIFQPQDNCAKKMTRCVFDFENAKWKNLRIKEGGMCMPTDKNLGHMGSLTKTPR